MGSGSKSVTVVWGCGLRCRLHRPGIMVCTVDDCSASLGNVQCGVHSTLNAAMGVRGDQASVPCVPAFDRPMCQTWCVQRWTMGRGWTLCGPFATRRAPAPPRLHAFVGGWVWVGL